MILSHFFYISRLLRTGGLRTGGTTGGTRVGGAAGSQGSLQVGVVTVVTVVDVELAEKTMVYGD